MNEEPNQTTTEWTLTEDEALRADEYAQELHILNKQLLGSKAPRGLKEKKELATRKLSCRAVVAAGRMLNVPDGQIFRKRTKFDFDAPNLTPTVHIKASETDENGMVGGGRMAASLILAITKDGKGDDRDDKRIDKYSDLVFVLLTTADRKEFHARGWIDGKNALELCKNNPQWFRATTDRPDDPAYFVPQAKLNPMPVDERVLTAQHVKSVLTVTA